MTHYRVGLHLHHSKQGRLMPSQAIEHFTVAVQQANLAWRLLLNAIRCGRLSKTAFALQRDDLKRLGAEPHNRS